MQQHYTAEPGTSSGTSIPSGGVRASRIREGPGGVGASAPSAGTMPDTGKSMSHPGHRLFQSPGMTAWCRGDRWMDRKVPARRGTRPPTIPDGKKQLEHPRASFCQESWGSWSSNFRWSAGGIPWRGPELRRRHKAGLFHVALGMVPRRLLPGFRVWCGLSRGLS